MDIQNLFESTAYTNLTNRIDKLSADSKAEWGKMSVSQMLAHCKQAFKVPLSSKPLPRLFIGRLIGWAIKGNLYNTKPWPKGLPTAPDFIIKDDRDFETEKADLLTLIKKFHDAGPQGAGLFPHPLFGRLNAEQWGKAMWKHMDHHLRQFGV